MQLLLMLIIAGVGFLLLKQKGGPGAPPAAPVAPQVIYLTAPSVAPPPPLPAPAPVAPPPLSSSWIPTVETVASIPHLDTLPPLGYGAHNLF
jgi:hypothetical protein